MRPGMGMDDFGGKGWGKGMPPPPMVRAYSDPFSSPDFGRGKGGFKGRSVRRRMPRWSFI